MPALSVPQSPDTRTQVIDHASPRTTEPFVMAEVSLLKDRHITDAAFRLFGILKSYARHKDYCWPSHQTLATDMGLQPRRIADLLKQLAAAGLIEIESRAKAGLSNMYRLLTHTRSSSTMATPTPTEKCRGGMQFLAGGGTQFLADEVHEEEIDKEEDHRQMVNCPKPEGASASVCVSVEGETLFDVFHHKLMKFGIAQHTARTLATQLVKHGRDMAYIECWQNIAKSKDNPAGYVVTMVRQNAEPPTRDQATGGQPRHGIPEWAKRFSNTFAGSQDDFPAETAMPDPAQPVVEGAEGAQTVQTAKQGVYAAVEAYTPSLHGSTESPVRLCDTPATASVSEPPGDSVLCQLLNTHIQEEYANRPKWERPVVRYACQEGNTLLVRFLGSPRPVGDGLLRQVQRLRPHVTTLYAL